MIGNNSAPEEMRCEFPNCGKILSSKYNLKRHIESCHNGVRPYACSICYKKFSSKQNKREHVRLEHSYSLSSTALSSRLSVNSSTNIINIPKLSALLYISEDPDIRPLSKVERIYLYSDLCQQIDLPNISESRQSLCVLPSFNS